MRVRLNVAVLTLVSGIMRAQDAAFAGTAVDALTGEALSGVHITLSQARGLGGYSSAWGAISDKEGHFSIDPMPAGDYYMRVERSGYVWFGPRENREPEWISLRRRIEDFALTLVREAVVRGHVVDEAGYPVESVPVGVIPASPEAFWARTFMGEAAVTNERGEFRIAGRPENIR